MIVMDDLLTLRRTARTVAVVVTHATDLRRAVALLVAEFGFDATFCALAAITDDVRAHQAMWLALEAATCRDEAMGTAVSRPDATRPG